jgi:transcription-repair coupling factor (superfamily II helicase)
VAISRLRRIAQLAGLSDVIATGSKLRIAPARLPDSRRVRLERMYPGAKVFAQNDVILVPFPTPGGEAPGDGDLIAWVSNLIGVIFPAEPAPESAPAAAEGSAAATAS